MGVDIYEYYEDSDGDKQVRWVGKVNSKGYVFVETSYTKDDHPYPYDNIGQVKVDYNKKEICVYDNKKQLVGKSIAKIEDGDLVNLVYKGNVTSDWNDVVGYMNASKRLCIAYGYSDKEIGYVVSDQQLSNTMFYFAATAYFLLIKDRYHYPRWRPHKIQKTAVDGMVKAWNVMDKVVNGKDAILPAFNKTREYMETVDNQYKLRCKYCGLGYSMNTNKENLCSGCFKMIRLGNKLNLKQCSYCGKQLPESCLTQYDVCFECSAYS